MLRCRVIQSGGHLIEPEHLSPPLPEVNSSSLMRQNRGQNLNVENVTKALKKAAGNRKSAAQILGVSRSTLYRFFARQENQI
jgi:transcriptional regulator of acetoin/glycerol metabolism